MFGEDQADLDIANEEPPEQLPQLSQNALFHNDPNRINTRADAIAKVTADDVQRVAKQYLVKTTRTVVWTTPKAGAGRGGAQ